MTPTTAPGRCGRSAAPRTRGDDPKSGYGSSAVGVCSPHPRGWPRPRAARRRHRRAAPRTRGDGPTTASTGVLPKLCSPRPGMVPAHGRRRRCRPRAPRARRDGPPRSTPLSRWSAAPRACLDGPDPYAMGFTTSHCSPHVRGWPLAKDPKDPEPALFPAPAGMAPSAIPDGCTDRLLHAPAGMVHGGVRSRRARPSARLRGSSSSNSR